MRHFFYKLTSVAGLPLLSVVCVAPVLPANAGIIDWLVEDETERAARLECEDYAKDRMAEVHTRSSLEDTRLCLSGIKTERFDPAIYCGDDLTAADRLRYYRRLLDDMAPPLYPDCPQQD